MATSAISGKSGTVTGAGGATEINEWSATLTVEALDATSFDSDGWSEFIKGLQGATGSLTCIGNAPTAGDVTLALGTGNSTISGDGILSSVEYSVAVDGVVTYSADFTFSGTVTVS